jgi:Phosphoadenosine phosphosulfate reductase family
MYKRVNKDRPVIAWWSGGIASAVTCYLCIIWYGVENVRVVFIDTHNEHPDTYRFKDDCEKWYGCNIETISNPKYDNIQDVWFDNLSLNIAKGAKCSDVLKIQVRQQFIKKNLFSYQAFGYDISEIGRAKDMKLSNPHLYPIFPLINELMDKKDCIKTIEKANDMFLSIEIPITYKLGYSNNNCFQTGCVKGGIGYWQKIQKDTPEKFDTMAKVEHDLTDLKGEPVTICKDQSKGGGLVFLKPHPKYPDMKDISMMKGKQPESLMECNGFCSPIIQTTNKTLTP